MLLCKVTYFVLSLFLSTRYSGMNIAGFYEFIERYSNNFVSDRFSVSKDFFILFYLNLDNVILNCIDIQFWWTQRPGGVFRKLEKISCKSWQIGNTVEARYLLIFLRIVKIKCDYFYSPKSITTTLISSICYQGIII